MGSLVTKRPRLLPCYLTGPFFVIDYIFLKVAAPTTTGINSFTTVFTCTLPYSAPEASTMIP